LNKSRFSTNLHLFTQYFYHFLISFNLTTYKKIEKNANLDETSFELFSFLENNLETFKFKFES
jgi:hypothetical protein